MKAYKGFNKDMTCRDFQYEEGKTYETDKAELCKSGFHACEDPIDCLAYYAPAESVYHEVELEDVCDKVDSDTKRAAKKITIGARLTIAQMVKACISFRFSKITTTKENLNEEKYGAASATGDRGAASATGKAGVAVAAGYECKAKGVVGCALFLVEREWDAEQSIYKIVHARACIVDGKRVKADTWYMLKDDKLVRV